MSSEPKKLDPAIITWSIDLALFSEFGGILGEVPQTFFLLGFVARFLVCVVRPIFSRCDLCPQLAPQKKSTASAAISLRPQVR
jgi:hypothetical protein